jgi:type IV pilus assembly protein PilX
VRRADGSLKLRNASFQIAEAVLRAGEAKVLTPGFALPQCPSPAGCLPPPEATALSGAAGPGASGMTWEASEGGFYGIQYLGQTDDPAGLPEKGDQEHRLYRVTAIAIQGTLRTVLESIHTQERRIMWRQRL